MATVRTTKSAPAKNEAPTKNNAPPKNKAPTKKKAPAKVSASSTTSGDLAKQIELRFKEIGGWRAETLARTRSWILEADSDLVEERKWIKPSNPFGVLAYSRNGLVLTLEVYKEYVKVTFASGSKVPDPTAIFNASLLGLRRAVDVREGAAIDKAAFQSLVRSAVAWNTARAAAK